jgi:hypothetical protein
MALLFLVTLILPRLPMFFKVLINYSLHFFKRLIEIGFGFLSDMMPI